ncbi:hypothetical protein GPECTOR_51g722 [Gonium pectorale]|uniref:AB hydrolase-1 domain-containing protein n=1 Tax=Gonium pectorale TaxID=33097 RepID=A0A150G794_GONPE|nr:hypothetical protein GPECTOR_51g722 [Gonium pectorale]|eukprot:KXZ45736.1 hypothetical protein GPECTOR_51g722 [Gonium pectorale]
MVEQQLHRLQEPVATFSHDQLHEQPLHPSPPACGGDGAGGRSGDGVVGVDDGAAPTTATAAAAAPAAVRDGCVLWRDARRGLVSRPLTLIATTPGSSFRSTAPLASPPASPPPSPLAEPPPAALPLAQLPVVDPASFGSCQLSHAGSDDGGGAAGDGQRGTEPSYRAAAAAVCGDECTDIAHHDNERQLTSPLAAECAAIGGGAEAADGRPQRDQGAGAVAAAPAGPADTEVPAPAPAPAPAPPLPQQQDSHLHRHSTPGTPMTSEGGDVFDAFAAQEPRERGTTLSGGGGRGSLPLVSTTLVQEPPADPRVSRAALPPEYDVRAVLLAARMGLAAVAFAAVVAAVAAAALSLVGWRQLLVLVAAAEAAFAMGYRRRYAALNAQPPRHAPERGHGLRAFNRLLEVTRQSSYVINADEYLSSWFCGADPGVIRQDNLADLLAYGFWYKSREEMQAEGQGPMLSRCVEQLMDAFGKPLPPGHTPGLTSMTHLWEPLRVGYRPLMLYAGTEVLALLCRAALLAMGFRLGSVPEAGGMLVAAAGMELPTAAGVGAGAGPGAQRRQQWAAAGGAQPQEPQEQQPSRGSVTPVVLLHGVGLGLLPYLNMLRCLRAAGLPILALEYKHVSLRLCSIIPSADDIAAALLRLMDRAGLEQACVVGHSYGTFVASRLAQVHPDRLQSLVLMDPVCFGMFLPHLLANFIYRKPRTSDLWTYIQDLTINFLSRDLHCAAAMCRRFYWSDLNLWPQWATRPADPFAS